MVIVKASKDTERGVMHGPAPFISKVMQVLVNMDKMVGDDFEAGLGNLQSVAEIS
jgi:hypothetical protein